MSAIWDTKALKAVPLNADEILIIDTADSRNQKRATIASLPFGITTSNVGAGEGLALPPVVNDFPFKSLIAGNGIELVGNANDITISLGAQTEPLDMNNEGISNLGIDEFVAWTGGLGITINASNQLETNSRTFLVKPSDLGTSRFIMNRDAILANDSIIGEYRAIAQNDAGTPDIEYSQVSFYMETDVAGSEEGSIKLRVKRNGINTEILTINDAGLHEVDIHDTVSIHNILKMNNETIEGVGNPVLAQDAATKIFVDNHDWLSTDITDFNTAVQTIVDAVVPTFSPDELADIPINNLLTWVGGLGITINSLDELEVNTKNFLFKPDDLGTCRLIMNRDTILAGNNIIWEMRAVSQDSLGTPDIEYGQLSLIMEDSTAGSEDGSFAVRLARNGTLFSEVFTINNSGDGEAIFHLPVNMNNSKIINVQNNPTDNQDATNKLYVDDHTWLHTDITDFDAGVQLNSPDQLAAIPIDGLIDWVGGKGLTINSSDEMVTTTKRIVIDTTDTARYVFFRNTILGTDQPVGNFRAISLNSIGGTKEFGQLTFQEISNINGAEEGAFLLRLVRGGNNVEFLKINDNASGQIELLGDLNMGGNIIDDAVVQNSVLENLSPNITYVKTEEDFGVIPPPVAVNSFNDAGGGEMNVITAVGHGLIIGNVVVFSGGTPYDGVDYEVVETQAAAAFKVVETFTSSSTGTSTAKKRQLFDVTQLTRLFYMMNSVNLTAPLLLTASGSQQVQYIFIQDSSEVNRFFVDYTDATLGAPFQGENIFSLVRVKVGTVLNATLMAANVKTLDVGFSSSSFEFFLDDQVSDFGSIHVRGAAFARIKNTSFYFLFDEGLQFTDCGSLEISDTGFNPNASLTTPVIEVLEPGGNPINAQFNNLDMGSLATGKDAIKLAPGSDPNSRFLVTNCIVPSDANLFDSTGLDQTDIKVLATGNIGHPDSKNIGSILANGNTTVTTIGTQGVWVDFNLDTNAVAGSNIELWSLDDTTTGELQYDGLDDFTGTLNAVIVVQPNGSKIYNIRAVKNGIVLSDTAVSRVSISGTLTSIPFTVPISVITNDLIRLQILEEDGTDDPTITDLSMTIQ